MTSITFKAKAKFAYAADPNYAQTMPIAAAETLVDVEEAGDGWMWGTSEISGKRGLFPASYVTLEEIKKKPPPPPPIPSAAKKSSGPPPIPPKRTSGSKGEIRLCSRP